MNIDNSKYSIPFDYHGISGGISVTFRNNQALEDFCKQYIPNYNPERFEIVALRFFAGKETIITVYALDKMHQKSDHATTEKLPVKKFKLENVPLEKLLCYFETFNFTIFKTDFPIEEMEVINR